MSACGVSVKAPLLSAFLVLSVSVNAEEPVVKLGGPSRVQSELSEADENRAALVEMETTRRVFRPWFQWKEDLKQDHGFSFGVNAWWLYQRASDPGAQGEDDAFGGIYRLQGTWTLTESSDGSTGRLEWRVENRHNSFTALGPDSLSKQLGVAALNTGFAYSDNFKTDLPVLSWVQGFRGSSAGVAAGRLAFDVYLDAFPFQTFNRGFLNRAFVVNPTMATTGIGGIGAVAKGFVSKSVWMGIQVHDANAVSGSFDWDTVQENEWLSAIEVGWTPQQSRYNDTRIQLSYWHKDARDLAGVSSGEGWVLSAAYRASPRLQGFVRGGHSDGGAGVPAESALSGGLEWQWRDDHFFSFGLGWAEPSSKTHGQKLSDETVVEASYKFQLTPNVSLTPDLQYLKNPALNPDQDELWIASARVILTL